MDSVTADALRAALAPQLIPSTPVTCYVWDGHGPTRAPEGSRVVHRDGHTFVEMESTLGAALSSSPGAVLPEFGHDRDGSFAWGTNLYPDSVIIASEPSVYRRVINDTRLDAVTVRTVNDILPVSSGD